MQHTKTALVFYGLLLAIYSAWTLYLLDQSLNHPQLWQQFQLFWIKWSLLSFAILIWIWFMLRPDENAIKRHSVSIGEAYARFCSSWGPWILGGWLIGLGLNTWNTATVMLIIIGTASLLITCLPFSPLTKLIALQFSLPLAMYVWGWQLWQWFTR